MDALKSLFSDFDLGSLIPDLNTVLGWVDLLMRIAVMAGPLLLLGFGLVYLFAPPKEANHSLGYRFWWGMSSLEAWRFTQRLAGMVWSVLGLVLTVIMALICNGFSRMQTMDMAWTAVTCLGWELGLTAVACVAINVVVILVFDRDGYRRGEVLEDEEEEDEDEQYEEEYEEELPAEEPQPEENEPEEENFLKDFNWDE